MKYAIMSDIHANPIALARVLDECGKLGVDQIVCAGDVVGYGPDPVGAIRLLRGKGVAGVMGNHDAALVGASDTMLAMVCANAGMSRYRMEFSADDLNWLGSQPFVHEGGQFAVAHSNFADPGRMCHVFTPADARPSFGRREEPLLFIGHTHIAAMFAFGIASDGDGRFPQCIGGAPRDFKVRKGWQYLINVGSVGVPRDGREASFVTYDSSSGTVRFHRVAFDYFALSKLYREHSLQVPLWVLQNVLPEGFSR